MNKITKNDLIKEILAKNIFIVSNAKDRNDWILLKNGSRTPLFLDTSKFNSHPELTEKINKFIIQIINEKHISFDRVSGIPYGGLPFSYGVSNILKVPCLSIRKEGKKTYGTAGAILGDYNKNEKVLLFEDATVTADTAVEFVRRLKEETLNVTDIITIIDVEKTGKENLLKKGVHLHNLFTWKELYEFYKEEKPDALSTDAIKIIDEFIK